MALSPQWLDELRGRTLLSALIGKSIKVTRAGREYKACCPFHNEKTPSFTINDEKGFYHCFGCGAHGDAIRWMTDQRGLPFMDAVKELAAAAGMDVPAPDPRASERQEAQKSLRDVTEAAAQWFHEQLNGAAGTAARAYLQQRGLSAETCRAFGIGLAPDNRTGLRSALNQFPLAMLVESGMLIQPPEDAPADRREPYDRFRGRLMIPIRDARGRTIAFGGRILGAGEPKYLNSPDTPLFDKGRVLFNLDRAAAAARSANRLIIVEGYMDVIALAQAGIAEAVAPLGTALTEDQLVLAWRQVPVPVLAFDGDAAGQRAAMRVAMRALPLLRPGHSLSILTLPAGKDPDDVVQEGGKAGFETLLDRALPLVDFLWAQALGAMTGATPEARAAVKAQLMGWCYEIADRDVGSLYRREFNERFSARFFARREAGRFAGNRTYGASPALRPAMGVTSSPAAPDSALSCAVLAAMLQNPSLITRRIDALAALPLADSRDRRLRDAIIEAASFNTALDSEGLMAILAPVDVYNRAVELVRADRVQLKFLDMDPAQGAADGRLDELLSALVAWPEVESALAQAEMAARECLDDASWQAQQQCLGARNALRQRLIDLADAGSA